MSCRYDLLVIDLDGTLLDLRGRVPAANVEAIGAARAAGLTVMIATGRALVESQQTLEAIGRDGIVIAAGGSLICDAATGRTLYRSAMPHDLVADVTEALLEDGHKVLLLKDPDRTGYDYLAVGPAELDPASAWWFEVMPVRVRFVHELRDDPHPAETVRVGAVAGEAELAPIAMHLKERVGERAFLQHWAAVTATEAIGSATHLLEVFNPNVDKWTAVRAYCEQKGVDPARVAAIGDGLNDVQLVREAGLGIAMGNADPRVAAVADRTTADNESEGVAEAIRKLLDGTW